MESQIPLPTDNIYKFYALFGLLLFISCMGSFVYIEHTTYEFVYQTAIEMESINRIANPSPADLATKEILDKHVGFAVGTKNLTIRALAVILAGSLYLMGYGFRKWHKEVQPVQDEMANLQLEKLRYEVSQLPKAASSSSAIEVPKEESLEAED
jgi:hypothetical protein